MKKSNLVAALGVGIALMSTAPVFAGTPRMDAREHHQRARIHNGVASGELTRPETRRLVAGQVHLHRVEARAKSDGVVTGRERAWMHHEANQQSRRIHRQKHDADARR